MKTFLSYAFACLFVFFTSTCYGQQPGSDSMRINDAKDKHKIAMGLKSPVSDLIVFQLSDVITFQGADPRTTINTFQVQPIIPIPLSKQLRIVTRLTATVNHLWAGGEKSKYGLGDVTTEFWLSPNYNIAQFGFGAGGIISYPTASNPAFGSSKWIVGPSIAIVKQQGAFTVGLVTNHQWSIGRTIFPVNTSLVDVWLGYTWSQGFTMGMESQGTYDWTSMGWVIPFQAGLGQLILLGKLPINFQLNGVYLLHGFVKPVWGANLTLSFVMNNF
jgi:hypothetical protein